MKIELNQEVFLVGIGNCARYGIPTRKGKVVKIGRKWFKVDTGDYIGEREEFSLQDGRSNGKEYMSEWMCYESEESYFEEKKRPDILKKVIEKINRLTNTQLEHILNSII